MPITNIYIVHENDSDESPIKFVGSRKEVCYKLDINDYWIYKLLRSKDDILANKYYTEVVRCNNADEVQEARKKGEKRKTPEKGKSKYEEYIQMLENMLDIYGNTGIFKNACKHRSAEKIIERIEKDGYHLKVTHEPRRSIKSLLTAKPEIYEECWIIELIDKEVKDK